MTNFLLLLVLLVLGVIAVELRPRKCGRCKCGTQERHV